MRIAFRFQSFFKYKSKSLSWNGTWVETVASRMGKTSTGQKTASRICLLRLALEPPLFQLNYHSNSGILPCMHILSTIFFCCICCTCCSLQKDQRNENPNFTIFLDQKVKYKTKLSMANGRTEENLQHKKTKPWMRIVFDNRFQIQTFLIINVNKFKI